MQHTWEISLKTPGATLLKVHIPTCHVPVFNKQKSADFFFFVSVDVVATWRGTLQEPNRYQRRERIPQERARRGGGPPRISKTKMTPEKTQK